MSQPGTDIREFVQRFPDNDACLEHLHRVCVGLSGGCPKCGGAEPWRKVGSRSSWRHSCGAIINPLRDTVFYRSNIPLGIWFYAILLFCNAPNGIRVSHLRKQTGLGLKSTLRLSARIRELFASVRLAGILGGEGETVALDTIELRCISRPGCTTLRPATILAIFANGQVTSRIIPDRRQATIVKQAQTLLLPGTRIITEQHVRYRALGGAEYDHFEINGHAACCDNSDALSNDLRAYRAALQRLMKALRQVRSENLWLYIAEAEFRFNQRHSGNAAFNGIIGDGAALYNYDPRKAKFQFDCRTPS
ncbi:MAG: transposase [Erythrobacter sp.]